MPGPARRLALAISVTRGDSGAAVAVGDAGLGWWIGGRVAVALGVRVGPAVAVTVAVAATVAAAGTVIGAVVVGDGRGVAVTASATVAIVSEVCSGDVGVAMQLVRSRARIRIRVRVQRIVVCASWLSLNPEGGASWWVRAPGCLSAVTC